MKWLKYQTLPSTQEELLRLAQLGEIDMQFPMVITCKHQTAGRGRADHSWEHFEGALAFSFTLSPHEIPTLTSLEVGLLLANFFTERFNCVLQLKWPNDLFNSHYQKCGGILINQFSENILVVGIGLNLAPAPIEVMGRNKVGSIFSTYPLTVEEEEQLPLEIVDYLVSHRLDQEHLRQEWLKNCIHRQMEVEIESGNKVMKGCFNGIGPLGEALIETAEGIEAAYSGSLSFTPPNQSVL